MWGKSHCHIRGQGSGSGRFGIAVFQPGHHTTHTTNLETGSASVTAFIRYHVLVVAKLILMFFVLIPQGRNKKKTYVDLPTAPTTPPGHQRWNTAYRTNYISICEANHRDVAKCCFEKQSSLISIFTPRVPNLFLNFSFFLCLSFFGGKNTRIQGLNAPLSLLSHFIWLHPPATFHTIECLASQ